MLGCTASPWTSWRMHRVRLGLESSRNRLSLTVTDTLLLLRHVQDGPLPNQDGERLLEVCVCLCVLVCVCVCQAIRLRIHSLMASGPLHGHRASTRLERSKLNAVRKTLKDRCCAEGIGTSQHVVRLGLGSVRKRDSLPHLRGTRERTGGGEEPAKIRGYRCGTQTGRAHNFLDDWRRFWRPRTLPRRQSEVGWRWVPCHIEERKKRGECWTTVKQKFGKEAVRCVHRRMKARLLGVWLRQEHGKEEVD